MHHQHPELDVITVRNRYNEYLREAEQDRLVREFRANQISLLQHVSRQIGKSFVWLGAKLIRYGRVSTQRTVHSA